MIADELVLQLVFSATFPLIATDRPERAVRIAHNHSRRLLSELYGYEEAQRAFNRARTDLSFALNPHWLKAMRLVTSASVFSLAVYHSLYRKKKNNRHV